MPTKNVASEDMRKPQLTSEKPNRFSGAPGILRSLLTRQSNIVWLVALLALPASRLASPNFPSFDLVRNVFGLGLFLIVVAFGQGLVILSGGLDLSVAATATMGAYFTGYFSTHGMPTFAAVLLALLIASLVGLVNGLIIAYTPFPAFIVTLAISAMASSLLLGLSAGTPSQRSPDGLTSLFSGSHGFWGVPLPIWFFVVVVAIGASLQSGTVFGRHVYAIGNSIRTAEISGIKVKLTSTLVYVVAGLSYGLAGVMLLGYGSGADLNVGNPWLLPSIAAVVVGGSSIKGGAGSYWGTAGAVVLLTILGIDISATGFSEGVKQIAYGLVILLALLGGRLATAEQ